MLLSDLIDELSGGLALVVDDVDGLHLQEIEDGPGDAQHTADDDDHYGRGEVKRPVAGGVGKPCPKRVDRHNSS